MERESKSLLGRLLAEGLPLQFLHAAAEDWKFGPLARLILASDEILESATRDWSYKSLAKFGQEEFILDASLIQYEQGREKQWMNWAISSYSESLYKFLWFEESEGLIFYVLDADGRFRPAEEGDPAYDFVRRIRTEGHEHSLRFASAPSWAEELFLSRWNWEAYDLVWHDHSSTDDPKYQPSKRLKAEAVATETARRMALAGEIAPLAEESGQRKFLSAGASGLDQAIIGSALCQLGEPVKQVQRLLGITRRQAANFLQRVIVDGSTSLYTVDAATGLWQPVESMARTQEVVQAFVMSSYVDGNDRDEENWGCWRITPAASFAAVAAAERVANRQFQPDAVDDDAERWKEEYLEQLRGVAKRSAADFLRLVCQSVVNLGAPLFTEAAFKAGPNEPARCIWTELAQYCLRRLQNDPVKQLPSGHVLLTEFIYGEFSPHIYVRPDDLNDVHPIKILDDAFREPSEAFERAIWAVAEMVYHGVPLFDMTADPPRLITEPNPLYVYLSMKGELGEGGDYSWEMPKWASGLAFESDHLDQHRLIFAAADDLTVEQVAARRIAFRRQIGIANDDVLPRELPNLAQATSKLSRLAIQTRERYYGSNFALEDQDSWPKQRDIVDWLKAQGLSEREAVAIDLVTRPDRLRNR